MTHEILSCYVKNRVLICKNGLRRMHENVRTCVLIWKKQHGVEDRYIFHKSLLQFSKNRFHLSRIKLTKWQLFVFSTQFYPDEKNARPALNIGYFLVILVGNGMFYYFPHCCTFIFSNWVHLFFQIGFRKCMLCKNSTTCLYNLK